MFRALIGFGAALGVMFLGDVSPAQGKQPSEGLSAEERARSDEIVTGALEASGAPSASVAVVKGRAVVFSKAYGNARLDPVRAATTNSRYHFGSVGKQFTASLVLKLADEGKLSLDDKVGKFMPAVAGAGEVTVRQLLSQTTGYPNYWVVNYLPISMRADIAPQAIVDRWAARPLRFKPGAQWEYSNTNYILAARIVELVENRPLAEILQARVFDPLQMKTAKLGDQPPFEIGDAAGYTRTALGPIRRSPRVPKGWSFGAGGLSMTAEDLARWDIGMLEQKLLTPEAYKAQQTGTKLLDGSIRHTGWVSMSASSMGVAVSPMMARPWASFRRTGFTPTMERHWLSP